MSVISLATTVEPVHTAAHSLFNRIAIMEHMSLYTFELLPQSWYKRRKPSDPERNIIEFEVMDFKKQDKHRCQIAVNFDDGKCLLLDARVYVNRTHTIEEDGSLSFVDNHWGVQGTNEQGISVVLRLQQAPSPPMDRPL